MDDLKITPSLRFAQFRGKGGGGLSLVIPSDVKVFNYFEILLYFYGWLYKSVVFTFKTIL